MVSKNLYGGFVEFVCPNCLYKEHSYVLFENYCPRCFKKFSNLDGTGKIVKMLKNE